ncbi:MAG: enoyl-CoA hydratase/isomerase family protein [Elusimicrobia bacterium]|nr:enoyl-CoA hydratase/isomerase family protein [Elusimicrobiota bacterium]
MANYDHIRVVYGKVSEVVLNRPEVRNAMSDRTLDEITHAFRNFAMDGELRAVLVRAEGKDFCAGADIEWMKRAGRLPAEQGRRDAERLVDMCQSVEQCPVPVIARVHGNIYGGGLGLVAACDIVLAEAGARMCFSEARLGIIPAVISCFVVPKIGEWAARRYYLTAEVFGMDVARQMGLVHEAAAEVELEPKITAILENIQRNGPNAVREAKALLRKFPGLPFQERVELVLDTLVRLRGSPEGQEGFSAFLEKRKPAWIKTRA